MTVVFAWDSLKLREWRKFQIYMAITIICAALFMVLKGIEYNAKFHHQAMRLDDYTVIEGHAVPQGDDKKITKNFNIQAEDDKLREKTEKDVVDAKKDIREIDSLLQKIDPTGLFGSNEENTHQPSMVDSKASTDVSQPVTAVQVETALQTIASISSAQINTLVSVTDTDV